MNVVIFVTEPSGGGGVPPSVQLEAPLLHVWTSSPLSKRAWISVNNPLLTSKPVVRSLSKHTICPSDAGLAGIRGFVVGAAPNLKDGPVTDVTITAVESGSPTSHIRSVLVKISFQSASKKLGSPVSQVCANDNAGAAIATKMSIESSFANDRPLEKRWNRIFIRLSCCSSSSMYNTGFKYIQVRASRGGPPANQAITPFAQSPKTPSTIERLLNAHAPDPRRDYPRRDYRFVA